MEPYVWLIAGIALALAFDVINGFHDAANSVATLVSTRVLSPRVAVLWAAFFNTIAMFVFAPRVADTISKTVNITPGDGLYVVVVVAGVLGAIAWGLLTWWWGLPSSSSHAIIGGFAGAGVAHAGWGALRWDTILKILAFIPLAPVIGVAIAMVLVIVLERLLRRARPAVADRWMRRGQLVSAAAYSLGHGGNDAQKTMGIIVALLIASGSLAPGTQLSMGNPKTLWIILACNLAMGIGTAMGGYKIIRTMGMKITKLRPLGGFAASASGALVLFYATAAGIPVSTTHTITGSIVGVGAARRLRAVKWGVAQRIAWGWLVTVPAAAIIAMGCFHIAASVTSQLTRPAHIQVVTLNR